MTTATHIPTKLMLNQGALSSTLGVNFGDTGTAHFKCGIVVAGTGIPNTTYPGLTTIADLTGANAEMSYAGYARQALAGITWAVDGTVDTQIDWSFSSITFPEETADPGTGRYGFIAYLGPSGSYADAAAPVVAVLDFGQTVSTANASLTLAPPAGGLIQFTGGG
ncbi:MAG: hypothetical protein ACREFX_07450 [Opitutaceae bacterium]